MMALLLTEKKYCEQVTLLRHFFVKCVHLFVNVLYRTTLNIFLLPEPVIYESLPACVRMAKLCLGSLRVRHAGRRVASTVIVAL